MNQRTSYLDGEQGPDTTPLLPTQFTADYNDPATYPAAAAPPTSSRRPGSAEDIYPPITVAYVGGDGPVNHSAKVTEDTGDDAKPQQAAARMPVSEDAPHPPYPAATAPPPPAQGYPLNAPLPGGEPQVWVMGTPPVYHPANVLCPYCGHVGPVRLAREVGLCAWLSAIGLCTLGCWPCFFLPFCCNATKDTVYTCGHCNAELGRRI